MKSVRKLSEDDIVTQKNSVQDSVQVQFQYNIRVYPQRGDWPQMGTPRNAAAAEGREASRWRRLDVAARQGQDQASTDTVEKEGGGRRG